MTSLISAIDPKFVISVASLLLSVCAFAFAVYQAVIGLGPYLSEERTILPLSKDHLTRIDWKLVNRGLGPAKIIRYEVLLNERPVDLSRLSEIIMAWNKAFGTVPDSGQMACKPPGFSRIYSAKGRKHYCFRGGAPNAAVGGNEEVGRSRQNRLRSAS